MKDGANTSRKTDGPENDPIAKAASPKGGLKNVAGNKTVQAMPKTPANKKTATAKPTLKKKKASAAKKQTDTKQAAQKLAAEKEAICQELLTELRCIALGEKGYPVYDKNGEESLSLPTMQARLKALELLGKHYALFAAEESENTEDTALEVEIHVV